MSPASDFIIKNGVLECYVGHRAHIAVPDGVHEIGKEAFALCRELVSVTMPDSVTVIGYQAFWNCEQLERVTMPSGVTHIGARAFAWCKKLQSITLPARLAETGHELCLECRSLAHVTLPVTGFACDKAFKGCEKLADRQGLVIVGHIVYDYCGKHSEVTVPDHVTGISGEAFARCRTLKRVVLGSGVRRIGAEAFAQCRSLEEIVFPDGLTQMDEYAFAECDVLASVRLPASLTDIGIHAFYHCTKLTRLEIPAATVRIGGGAFARCPDLHIRWTGEGAVGRGAFEGVHCAVVPGVPLAHFTTADAKHTAIRGFLQEPALYRDRASWMEYCKYAAGQRKKLLPEIFAGDMVSALAFYSEQKKITPANFETDFLNPAMAAGATNCIAFLLDWQSRHRTADRFALQLEQALTEDPYSAENMKKYWSYKPLPDGTLMLTSYKGTELNVQVPARIGRKPVTALDAYLFAPENRTGTPKPRARREALQQIASVQIPEGIVSIGACAFKDCTGLMEVLLPDSTTDIGDAAFRGCKGLADASGFVIVRDGLYDYCGQERKITVPDTVRVISGGAFRGNARITAVTLPESVQMIGKEAFRKCRNLSAITMPEGLTTVGDGAFAECTWLTAVHLPDRIVTMGDAVFGDCERLTTVHLPAGITQIGEYAFSGCAALKQISVPDGVTTIGAFAFAWCEALGRAELPSSVTEILYGAFVNCDRLQIYGAAGSRAEAYAAEMDIPFYVK